MNEPGDLPNIRGWLRVFDTMLGGLEQGFGCFLVAWILLALPGSLLLFLLYALGILD